MFIYLLKKNKFIEVTGYSNEKLKKTLKFYNEVLEIEAITLSEGE